VVILGVIMVVRGMVAPHKPTRKLKHKTKVQERTPGMPPMERQKCQNASNPKNG